MRGFLAEMQAHGRGGLAPAVAAGMRWSIIVGANDPLYDFADSEAHWREALPGADIEIVADAGRWPHLTHVDRVIAALARIAG
jgi:pimeloyl-ACP methyl ester carboxylesterase